jgi:hypothetical protein
MRIGYLLVRLLASYIETRARSHERYQGIKLQSEESMEPVVLTTKPRNEKYKQDIVLG